MTNFTDDAPLDAALRDGLRSLPVPTVSPDFDTRILAALQRPLPLWKRLWQPAQPLLAGASFSLIATLICLHWSLSAPVAQPPQALSQPILAAHPTPSLDALLDRPNLSAASLAFYWNAPPQAPTPANRPEPRRRAQSRPRESLVA